MSFKSLINIKMLESDIFYKAAEILQKDFNAYKDVNVCLPLNGAEGNICSVMEVRIYNLNNKIDIAAKHEFMYFGEHKKAYLITKFSDGYYHMSLFGHFTSISADIFLNQIKDIDVFKRTKDRTAEKTLPYELVAGAFNEFASELNKKVC
jgi:hypothetical protein